MSIKKTSNIRDDFSKSSIDFKLITKSPFKLFENWFEMALKSDKENAISFVLSTLIMTVIRLKILNIIIMFQLTFFGKSQKNKLESQVQLER